MEAELVRLVWQRAHGYCEYCRLAQEHADTTHEIDHIISQKHHGRTVASNLALSCFRCNSFKGSDIGGRDPQTRKLTPLFNPRRHNWQRHFRWRGPYIIGRTAIGRTTIDILNINDSIRVELREELIDEGVFPPR